MKAHIIVDMINDFITGSLACDNAEEAVKQTVNYINNNPNNIVVYICDSHPKTHCSFKENGGIWPTHCVKDSFGGSIHDLFFSIEKRENKPLQNNCFKKGENPDKEEYSGYNAVNSNGESLGNFLKNNNINDVIVSGIATEFCVKESVLDLIKNGFNVTILKDTLGYVNKENHLKTLNELNKTSTIL